MRLAMVATSDFLKLMIFPNYSIFSAIKGKREFYSGTRKTIHLAKKDQSPHECWSFWNNNSDWNNTLLCIDLKAKGTKNTQNTLYLQKGSQNHSTEMYVININDDVSINHSNETRAWRAAEIKAWRTYKEQGHPMNIMYSCVCEYISYHLLKWNIIILGIYKILRTRKINFSICYIKLYCVSEEM